MFQPNLKIPTWDHKETKHPFPSFSFLIIHLFDIIHMVYMQIEDLKR